MPDHRRLPMGDPRLALPPEELDRLLNNLIQSWPRGGLSDHLAAEVAAAVYRGRSLSPGEPLPGCVCATCTGLPEDHPARLPAWRRSDPELAAQNHAQRRKQWAGLVERARAVSLLNVTERLGLGEPVRRGRSLLFRCPLHEDRHPSLSLDTAHGRWYCHACAEGGDGIALFMRARRLDFATAVRELAA